MFKIENSEVKLTNIREVSDKMTVGTLYSTHKDEVKNTFVKTFIECKLVGKALAKYKELGIKPKEKFKIIEGSLRNEPYVDRIGTINNKHVITIFDLEAV